MHTRAGRCAVEYVLTRDLEGRHGRIQLNCNRLLLRSLGVPRHSQKLGRVVPVEVDHKRHWLHVPADAWIACNKPRIGVPSRRAQCWIRNVKLGLQSLLESAEVFVGLRLSYRS